MLSLPYDVWLHIANFLDEKTVRSLYAVNSILFDIAMKRRYKVAYIAGGCRLPYAKQVGPKLKNNRLMRHTRTLFVRDGDFPQERNSIFYTIHRNMKSAFRSVKGHLSGTTPAVDPYVAHLKVMSGLTGLVGMQIESEGPESPEFHLYRIRMVDAGMKAAANNLTSLVIVVPLEHLEDFLPKATRLNSLQKFTALITSTGRRPDQSRVDTILTSTLLPFIRAHHKSLTSLGLLVSQDINISALLADIPHLPCLHTLSLAQGFEANSDIALRVSQLYSKYPAFFNAHRTQLKHLSIEFSSRNSMEGFYSSAFFSPEWCSIPLPNLQSLSLELTALPDVFDDGVAVAYLQKYAATLVSLTLKDCLRCQEHFDSLLAVFTPVNLLRNLELQVRILKVQTLTALANSLPDLESLKITFHVLVTEDVSGYESESNSQENNWLGVPYWRESSQNKRWNEFVDDLDPIQFRQWRLRSLDLVAANEVFKIPGGYSRTLEAAFPNVEWFGNASRRDYI